MKNQFFIIAIMIFVPATFHFAEASTSPDPLSLSVQPYVTETQSATQIENFHEVIPGKIYRGAQPTDEGLQYLAAHGIKTVINLRNVMIWKVASELKSSQALGMRMLWFPLHTLIAPEDAEIEEIEKALLNPAHYPIFIHCAKGEDRTGLVIGLFRALYQKPPMSPAEAWREMIANGFHTYYFRLADFFVQKTGYRPSEPIFSRFRQEEDQPNNCANTLGRLL